MTDQDVMTGHRKEVTGMAEQICPKCWMAKSDWKGNNGEGYTKDGQTYCCQGCAEDTGCTCLGGD